MTTTSYDNNFMLPLSGKDWCSLKCENDLAYIEPFKDGDLLKFFMALPTGQYIHDFTITDWSDNTISGPTIAWNEYYDSLTRAIITVIMGEPYCSSASAQNKCFRLNLRIHNAKLGVTPTTYLYTIKSNKYSCTFCEPTVWIESVYNNQDCLGNYYDNDDIPQESGHTYQGDYYYWTNGKRIYATLKKLPSRLSLSSNTNCYLYKSELIETYELQGTRLYPPYVARQVENIMLGRTFKIDGEEFQVRGNSIFEPVREPGMTMFRLKAQLEKCPCEVVFDCV